MVVFMGVDPSINSSGICIQFWEDNSKVKEYFAIVKPDKLTKKEQKAHDAYLFFDYVLYEKHDLSKYEDNHEHEHYKTLNMIAVLDKIIETVKDNVADKNVEIYVVQEGVSYGSTLKTKSVFDLAGLNFMIRERFLKDDRFHLTIATPSEIKKYSSGNGNCKKEVMMDLFKILYPDFNLPKLDDICDAYFMASYAKYLYDKEQTL